MQFRRKDIQIPIVVVLILITVTLACGNSTPEAKWVVETNTVEVYVSPTQSPTVSSPTCMPDTPEPTATNTLVVPLTATPQSSPTDTPAPPEITATNTLVIQLDNPSKDKFDCVSHRKALQTQCCTRLVARLLSHPPSPTG